AVSTRLVSVLPSQLTKYGVDDPGVKIPTIIESPDTPIVELIPEICNSVPGSSVSCVVRNCVNSASEKASIPKKIPTPQRDCLAAVPATDTPRSSNRDNCDFIRLSIRCAAKRQRY